MLFSVIVPIYNVQKYLKRCVDSVLSQTFEDYELILFTVGHSNSRDWENNPFPSQLTNFIKRQHEAFDIFIYGQLVRLACDGFPVNINFTAYNSVAAYQTAHK